MATVKLDGGKKIFFTSDPHAFHKNITRGATEWVRDNEGKDTRDFDTVEEMTQAIVDGINKYVGKDDILVCLGDWSFGGRDNILRFRQMLTVDEIHFVLGNHDHHIEKNKPFSAELLQELGLDMPTLGTQDLFQTINDVALFKIGKKSIFCSHYAHRVWDLHQHGRWHLYGHSHGSLEEEPHGKSLDVGVDAAFARFGEYRPFSMRDLYKIMDEREIHTVDHHNSETT